MSPLCIGLKDVSLKDVGLKDVSLKDVVVPLSADKIKASFRCSFQHQGISLVI